jgi:hypothetical protein
MTPAPRYVGMHRTTTPTQRVDMLLVQAEDFAELTGLEEAIARARQAIAYAQLEMEHDHGPMEREQLAQRIVLAEGLIARLGARKRNVRSKDAILPESWDL